MFPENTLLRSWSSRSRLYLPRLLRRLLFDNPELDIECFVKFYKSIDVVIDLIKAVFHVGESFPQLFYNLHVARMK